MKKKVDLKFVQHAFLQSDGSLLVVHGKHNYKTKKIEEWAKLYKNIGVENKISDSQVVIHGTVALALLLRSRGINYIEPTRYSGQNLNTEVGYIQLYFAIDGKAYDEEAFYIPFVPGIVGSNFTINKNKEINHKTFEALKEYGKCGYHGTINILKVIE